MALTAAQQAHVDAVFPECKAQIADYLERGVEVVYFRQNECGDDVPPIAVAPSDQHDYWIGCWDTPEQAIEAATALGLKVLGPVNAKDLNA
ncbi:TPA: hypothetical protein ACKP9S_006027 [Pseudomonas aeruginosa]